MIMKLGEPLKLEDYGGPNVDIILRYDQATSFGVLFVDHENLVQRVSINPRAFPELGQFYSRYVEEVPTITKEVIKKEDGESDGGLSKLYPVYKASEGEFQVFLSDSLAVPAGKRKFVIRAGSGMSNHGRSQ